MMRADAGFHADQARWHVGKACFYLAACPLVPQHNRAALIVANNVERVLTDIDANYGNCTRGLLGHAALLVFGAPSQFLARVGLEHGRTIPLTDVLTRLLWVRYRES